MKPFRVTWTYDRVTEESAADGDTSERGFYSPGGWYWPIEDGDGYHEDVLAQAKRGEMDTEYGSLSDLRHDMRDNGVGWQGPNDTTAWASSEPSQDMREGYYETLSVHFDDPRLQRHMSQLRRLLA